MTMRYFVYFCLIFFLFLCDIAGGVNTPQAYAATPDRIYAGLKTSGMYLPEADTSISIAVWYPTRRRATTHTIDDWNMVVARDATPVAGQFPLVILSHGMAENRFSYHALAAEIARNGFIVAALTHPYDNSANAENVFTAQQFFERPQHIALLLDHLTQEPALRDLLYPNKTIFIGFGMGATTGLLLAGSVPNPNGWHNYCASQQNQTLYCTKWASARIEAMIPELASFQAIQKPLFQALVLVEPAYPMLFPPESIPTSTPPIMLVQTEFAKENNGLQISTILRHRFHQKPELVELAGIDYYALLSAGSPETEKLLPATTATIPLETRMAAQKKLSKRIIRFLIQHTYHSQ